MQLIVIETELLRLVSDNMWVLSGGHSDKKNVRVHAL